MLSADFKAKSSLVVHKVFNQIKGPIITVDGIKEA